MRIRRHTVRIIGLALLAMLLWVSAVALAPLAGIGRRTADGPGTTAFMDLARRVAADHRGNVVIMLVEKGAPAATHSASISEPVSPDTMFQMASVSKMVTAWGVMRLAEKGQIDLDAPISRYLSRWRLPPTEQDNDAVTVRRLLAHTAGLGDGLGSCGFAPGESVQSLEASLTVAADACPLRSGKTRADHPAGEWHYSGGGYSMLQLLIEEVSGKPFAEYMETEVLRPLGMVRSTFRTGAAGLGDLAQFHDSDGSPAPHNLYTAAAAASLYSSASDMTRFAQAHLAGHDGSPPGRGVLSPRAVSELRRPHAHFMHVPHFGLGTMLYGTSRSGGPLFGHDGGNVPAVNTTVRIEATTGDALVILSTGGSAIASRLGSAWLAQRQLSVTPYQRMMMIRGSIWRNMSALAFGLLLVMLVAGTALVRSRRH